MAVKVILAVVALLWLFGFINIPFFNATLFTFFGHGVTLRDLLLLGLIGYLISFLPGLLQKIVIILFVLWLLSTFVFPAFGFLGQFLLIIILLAVIFSFI